MTARRRRRGAIEVSATRRFGEDDARQKLTSVAVNKDEPSYFGVEHGGEEETTVGGWRASKIVREGGGSCGGGRLMEGW